METFKKIAHQKSYLESLGYNVLYIGLYGSQNYNLDDELSDIDLRAIVLPSFEQLIKKEKISEQLETDLGHIDVKDILTFYEVVRKGNFAFIEPMQTKWFIGDEYLRTLFGDIELSLVSLRGDMINKNKAFRAVTPSRQHELDKYGYDPKQLHHIFRMMYLLQSGDVENSFIDYTNDEETKKFLIDVKRNKDRIIDSLDFIDISSETSIKKWINVKAKEVIAEDYVYEPIDRIDEVIKYIEKLLKNKLCEG